MRNTKRNPEAGGVGARFARSCRHAEKLFENTRRAFLHQAKFIAALAATLDPALLAAVVFVVGVVCA